MFREIEGNRVNLYNVVAIHKIVYNGGDPGPNKPVTAIQMRGGGTIVLYHSNSDAAKRALFVGVHKDGRAVSHLVAIDEDTHVDPTCIAAITNAKRYNLCEWHADAACDIVLNNGVKVPVHSTVADDVYSSLKDHLPQKAYNPKEYDLLEIPIDGKKENKERVSGGIEVSVNFREAMVFYGYKKKISDYSVSFSDLIRDATCKIPSRPLQQCYVTLYGVHRNGETSSQIGKHLWISPSDWKHDSVYDACQRVLEQDDGLNVNAFAKGPGQEMGDKRQIAVTFVSF